MVSDVMREKNKKHVYLFWTKVTSKAESIDVGFRGGLCEGDFTETAKDLNRHEYFEANSTIVACIQNQFDQHGHIILRTL